MLLVGLTGGIGSGKSTVAAALATRGAAVVDADQLAREVVEPGGPAYEPLVARFGTDILRPDGLLDRQRLADIAFGDADSLRALNDITHPAIATLITERVAQAARDHDIVVVDIPLLTVATKARLPFDAVVVVDAPIDTAVQRLVDQRNFGEADARARIAAQMSREERRETADLVIDNSRDRAHLDAEIDRLWEWLQPRARRGGTDGR